MRVCAGEVIAAWVVRAILVFGLDAAGSPYTYARYESVCTAAEERSGSMSPKAIFGRR